MFVSRVDNKRTGLDFSKKGRERDGRGRGKEKEKERK